MSSTFQFPPTYVFRFLLDDKEIKELEDELDKFNALRYTVQEAQVGLTKIPTKARVEFELRKLKFTTVDVTNVEKNTENLEQVKPEVKQVAGKKRKAGNGKKKQVRKSTLNENGYEVIELSSSEEDDGEEDNEEVSRKKLKSADGTSSAVPTASMYERETVKVQLGFKMPDALNVQNTFKVLNKDWYFDSVREGRLLPMDNYLIYEGQRIMEPPKILPSDILTRAAADLKSYPNPKYNHHYRHQQSSKPLTRPTFLTQTTSEHDDPEHYPPLPEYLKTQYSCERPTPLTSPNDDFLTQLQSIKLKRTLDGDRIGVRAYSTSIASIAAYPYVLTSPNEVIRLPGCDQKIANLFLQYQNTGTIDEVIEFQINPRMQVLRLFYNIWGAGDATARHFYDKNGWRDLDDIIEYGWDKLTRVQQIGVKYYDEFLLPIPRAEVEEISSTVLSEARKIDKGYQMVIVGGYRRGKENCGDVDLILTHPDEKFTFNFISGLTERLEELGWITNVLLESIRNLERGQHAVDLSRAEGERSRGGFDTLDKALVVWQDINFSQPSQPLPQPSTSQTTRPKIKNPNIHRRVDIIISPWKTAGAAIIGWSGGTTFQRDLRKYFKEKKNWRFDSSGIRDRRTGEWIDLEGCVEGSGEGKLREKEMAVFRGVGLEWREPWERCTG
ncbi:7d729867-6ab4-4547-91b6-f796cf908cf4-CDS [Sclerotinia trifoliorum]|uniref:DNA polymerase n=1 Tax=Sclerotinia trifoliorum TaxID=28548 RepID=A0A8H2VMY4_9HELO|nr:7d729867-6ab4-4547-91b6-f796cf908cf4-CDS [Sclerotinia trifoliorum]